MDLSERKKQILKAVIDNYIETAEPVGSKAIAEGSGLSLSSATIRNEMAELESLGCLEQPHPSAGRIPTPHGYRIYVNELMRRHKLTLEEAEQINAHLKIKAEELDTVVANAGKLASELMKYPAYALTTAASTVTIRRFDIIYIDSNSFIIVVMLDNCSVKNKLVRLPIQVDESFLKKTAGVFNANFTGIPESGIDIQRISNAERALGDELGIVAIIASFAMEILKQSKSAKTYLEGASHILELPEYRNFDKAQKLLNYLSDKSELIKLPIPENEGSAKILIGPENVSEALRDSSVVVVSYDMDDGMQGLIGVVGPTRMDYAKVSARLSHIVQGINKILKKGNISPPSDIT